MKATGTTQIPLPTLKAIKEVLFSKTNGVDLTSIINDLSLGNACGNELVAINVALVYNGYTPEIEKAPRYEYCYGGFYCECKMLKHSLILDGVLVEKTRFLVEDGIEKKTDCNTVTISYDQWIKLETTKAEVLEKIKKVPM